MSATEDADAPPPNTDWSRFQMTWKEICAAKDGRYELASEWDMDPLQLHKKIKQAEKSGWNVVADRLRRQEYSDNQVPEGAYVQTIYRSIAVKAWDKEAKP